MSFVQCDVWLTVKLVQSSCHVGSYLINKRQPQLTSWQQGVNYMVVCVQSVIKYSNHICSFKPHVGVIGIH